VVVIVPKDIKHTNFSVSVLTGDCNDDELPNNKTTDIVISDSFAVHA